jgi:hypothetical protein
MAKTKESIMDNPKEKIVVDGATYVLEDTKKMNEDNYAIIRTYAAGVFAGHIIETNLIAATPIAILKNARRLWYWDGAASLSQMAMDGVTKPNNCKFAMEIPKIELTGVIEVIPCTKKATTNIKGVPVWKK